MVIRKAEGKDFNEIQQLYWTIAERMEGMPYDALWRKEVYPSDEFIRSSIEAGELFLIDEAEVIGAMILNHSGNEGYRRCQWSIKAEDSEVLFVHALGVHPDFQGKGLSKALVSRAIKEARLQQLKAVRLDVVPANLPAVRLYESFGFRFCQKVKMYYEDTGWMEFLLYELPL